MALGNCVIAHDTPENRETLGDAGFTYDGRAGASALRDVLRTLLADPELVREYLGSVVPYADNKHATLNSAVFTDGSFVYVPKGVRCPMELSTYFRINAAKTGQFERTLIIADEGSKVHYIEGCSAPVYSTDSLHSAVVEIVVKPSARAL